MHGKIFGGDFHNFVVKVAPENIWSRYFMCEERLCFLEVGESAVVTGIEVTGALRRRFQDIGLISGTKIKSVLKSPCGTTTAYLIRGAVIAIRQGDAWGITIRKIQN